MADNRRRVSIGMSNYALLRANIIALKGALMIYLRMGLLLYLVFRSKRACHHFSEEISLNYWL